MNLISTVDYLEDIPTFVTPVAIVEIPGHYDLDAVAIYDLISGCPLRWVASDKKWKPVYKNGNLIGDQVIDGIHGGTGEVCESCDSSGYVNIVAHHDDEGCLRKTWEDAANEQLKPYGVKLGAYVPRFGFLAVDGRRHDGYLLEAI